MVGIVFMISFLTFQIIIVMWQRFMFSKCKALFLLHFSMRAFQQVKNHFIWRRFDFTNHILNIHNPQSGSSTWTSLKVHLFDSHILPLHMEMCLHSFALIPNLNGLFNSILKLESFMFSLIPTMTFCCLHYYKNMASMPLIIQLQ
jgi:hypothetical protein